MYSITRENKIEETIETLTQQAEQHHEKIQALLDFAFTDRGKWKEGQKNQDNS